MNKINAALCATLLTTSFSSSSYALPVDLNTWTPESYPAVQGFDAGSWTVSADGSTVNQSINGQPTLFYSDFDTFGSSFTGSITVFDNIDDDYIGFVLGFNPGDTSSATADYLLIDWKKNTQPYDFGAPSSTPGSTADVGLAVSRVTGIPTADEFWGHTDFASDTSGAVEELQRGINLGSTGWSRGVTYDFTFDFGPTDLEVYVDGVLELDINGSFNDGRFGFYNFSQSNVTYAGFEKDVGSFPGGPVPTPEPPVALLMLAGLFGFSQIRKRRR